MVSPPELGWESEKAAFRCYDGHFDLFGKRTDTLIYKNISKAAIITKIQTVGGEWIFCMSENRRMRGIGFVC